MLTTYVHAVPSYTSWPLNRYTTRPRSLLISVKKIRQRSSRSSRTICSILHKHTATTATWRSPRTIVTWFVFCSQRHVSRTLMYLYLQTLQRQLDTGLADQEAAIDWCKNCMGIADFYLALQVLSSCLLQTVISHSAECVLISHRNIRSVAWP